MFNKYLILLPLLCFCPSTNSYGEWKTKAGGGIHLTSELTADSTSSRNQLPILRSSDGSGLHVMLEQQVSFFGIGLAGQYTYHKSKAQYDYINPDNASIMGNVSDLKTNAYFYMADIYLSFDLITLGTFKFYVAGGPSFGFATLQYNKDDYISKNGNTIGFIEKGSDVESLAGYFGEAGFEISGNEFGGQLKATYHNTKTGNFVSLGGKKFMYKEKALAFSFFRVF